MVETQPEFKINIEGLKKVMPEDIKASDIGVKLGSTWIPQEIINEFMYQLLNTGSYEQGKIKANYSSFTGAWYISCKSYDYGNVKAYNAYGTSRINACFICSCFACAIAVSLPLNSLILFPSISVFVS